MSKSHVQIPASLLKPFSINKNTYKVYVMNTDGLITEESIKKCNTIENYYSDYVESEILANLESCLKKEKISRPRYLGRPKKANNKTILQCENFLATQKLTQNRS